MGNIWGKRQEGFGHESFQNLAPGAWNIRAAGQCCVWVTIYFSFMEISHSFCSSVSMISFYE